MKIGLVSTAVGLGGAERYLVELARWLAEAGSPPVLIVAEEIAAALVADLGDARVPVVAAPIGWDWGPEDDTGGEAYRAKLDRQRDGLGKALQGLSAGPDVLLLNANWPTHYLGALQAAMASGLPYGVHFHLCPHQIHLNPDARAGHAETLGRAAFLSCVSRNNRFFLEQTFGTLLEFRVILNGSRFEIDDDERARLAVAARQDVMLLVGRLDHQKGILDMLPALAQPDALAGMALHVLGDGPLRGILASAAERAAVPVVLQGRVEDVRDRLASARAMLLPSHFEGLSLSILEAMSLGCIPVVSRASSAAELIEDGRTGFLFDVADWRSMLAAVRRLAACDEAGVRANCLQAATSLTRRSMLDSMHQQLRAVA